MDKTIPVPFTSVKITDGFWKKRKELNENVTIYAVRDRFIDTGRFEAFKFNWKEGSDIPKPHIFWDSDVAKWMESVAYILAEKEDKILRSQVEELVSLMEINQQEDGYFNIAHTVVHPEDRFKIRNNHELYCLGHFIEAAVAWKESTGSDRLITITDKYIDLVIRIFCVERSAEFVTPGHEEIELALIRLYRLTKNKKYLDLALFFLNERGLHNEGLTDWCNSSYNQSHLPVRQQREAMGHAVRACYLYSAMADAAKETDDKELLDACTNIFNDIVHNKMYITGGIGSSHHGEAFTVAYDLPNNTAYAETCASISLMMFADRMKDIILDSKYADIVEREIYNGIISGISLDGKAFFYENPLEINLSDRNKHTSMKQEPERLPITQRQEVFSCSCCPPNLTRFFAGIGEKVFSENNDSVFLHQYIPCTALMGDMTISVETEYPVSGKIKINVKNGTGKYLYVRIPGWCENYSISESFESVGGYAKILIYSDEITVFADFVMEPVFYLCKKDVRANANKAALMYGPVVYCFEKFDNPYINHWSLRFDTEITPEVIYDKNYSCNILIAQAFEIENSDKLYYNIKEKKENKVTIKLIPYFAFANRGESDMTVWFNI